MSSLRIMRVCVYSAPVTTVAVAGASGYAGGELLRYLAQHRDLTPVFGPDSRMVQLGCVECFELGRGEHIQSGVPPARVMEVLDVVGDSHAEFLDRGPGLGVEQFGLHPPPRTTR